MINGTLSGNNEVLINTTGEILYCNRELKTDILISNGKVTFKFYKSNTIFAKK